MEQQRGQRFVVTDHEHLGIVNWINLLVVCWLKHYTTEVAKQFYVYCTG